LLGAFSLILFSWSILETHAQSSLLNPSWRHLTWLWKRHSTTPWRNAGHDFSCRKKEQADDSRFTPPTIDKLADSQAAAMYVKGPVAEGMCSHDSPSIGLTQSGKSKATKHFINDMNHSHY
jgi:hypothetical protein